MKKWDKWDVDKIEDWIQSNRYEDYTKLICRYINQKERNHIIEMQLEMINETYTYDTAKKMLLIIC